MSDPRKVIFANNEIYHVFNRGVDKRPTFTGKRELDHALQTIQYYQFSNIPLRYSKYLILSFQERVEILHSLYKLNSRRVKILAYCFMPNHFHFLLQQCHDQGISRFVADFTNSHTKYFNIKHERTGPLFQGVFKATHVSSDEQFLHVSRYIHLNPVSSFLIKPEQLEDYRYSSFSEYMNSNTYPIVTTDLVLSMFSSKKAYRKFVFDHVDYARKLEQIKHLVLE